MITVSIVENNLFFRNAIIGSLDSRDIFEIKGTYASAALAMKRLLKDMPDIVIIEMGIPGINGIKLLRDVMDVLPATQFLVHTVFNDDETIFNALRAGVKGYLLKDADCNALARSVIDLYNGGSPISPYIARIMIRQFMDKPRPIEIFELTTREQEILRQLAKGFLYKEMAHQMNISVFTVKNHLKNIYRKLNVQNKVEALNKFQLIN